MQIGGQPFLNLADNPRGVGCATKSNFGRMSRRQQSNWRLHFTGKQIDMIYPKNVNGAWFSGADGLPRNDFGWFAVLGFGLLGLFQPLSTRTASGGRPDSHFPPSHRRSNRVKSRVHFCPARHRSVMDFICWSCLLVRLTRAAICSPFSCSRLTLMVRCPPLCTCRATPCIKAGRLVMASR